MMVMRRIRAMANMTDEGAATAEFAVVLPAVMVMAILLLYLARAVIVSMSCQDAAATIARELVVNGDADAGALAQRIAGNGARASVAEQSDQVNVIVHCPVIPDPLGILPEMVTGKATGVR